MRKAYGVVAAAILIMGTRMLAPQLLRFRVLIDFLSYYTAAIGYRQGNIYDVDFLTRFLHPLGLYKTVIAVHSHMYPYVYPPAFAFYLQPLGFLRYGMAYRLWLLGSWALLLGTTYLIWRMARAHTALWGLETKPYAFAVILILLVYTLPFDVDLSQGQVNILLVFLMTLALMWGLEGRREGAAGVALAAAALIKLTPILLLAYFLVERRWRLIAATLGAAFLIALPTLLFGGWAHWLAYLHFLLRSRSALEVKALVGTEAPYNISLLGAWSRVLGRSTAALILHGLSVLILFLIAMRAHARARARGRGRWTALLAYLAAMVLAAPYGWIVHIVYLLPGAVWVLYALWERDTKLAWGLLLALLFAGLDFPELYGVFPLLSALPPAARSLNTGALLFIYLLGVYTTLREGRGVEGEA